MAPSCAPQPNIVFVTVTPQADPSKKAQATITILGGTGISLSPITQTIAANQRFTLSASVSGLTDTTLNWSVKWHRWRGCDLWTDLCCWLQPVPGCHQQRRFTGGLSRPESNSLAKSIFDCGHQRESRSPLPRWLPLSTTFSFRSSPSAPLPPPSAEVCSCCTRLDESECHLADSGRRLRGWRMRQHRFRGNVHGSARNSHAQQSSSSRDQPSGHARVPSGSRRKRRRNI